MMVLRVAAERGHDGIEAPAEARRHAFSGQFGAGSRRCRL
jgi:hypothetical protein